MYALLFQAASETILELCADRKYLGATPGVTAILHTWGQNLQFHPHIHMIVTGGGAFTSTRTPTSAFTRVSSAVLTTGAGSTSKGFRRSVPSAPSCLCLAWPIERPPTPPLLRLTSSLPALSSPFASFSPMRSMTNSCSAEYTALLPEPYFNKPFLLLSGGCFFALFSFNTLFLLACLSFEATFAIAYHISALCEIFDTHRPPNYPGNIWRHR